MASSPPIRATLAGWPPAAPPLSFAFMWSGSGDAAEEHARWMAAAGKRKRHAEAAQRSRQRQRESLPMRRRRTAAELTELAAKPADTRTPQENEALRSHEKEMRRKCRRITQSLVSSTPIPGPAAAPAAAPAAILATSDHVMSPIAATPSPSIASMASTASQAAAPALPAASSHAVSLHAPPLHRLSAEQCKWARRARRRAMAWLAGGLDRAPPPASLPAESPPSASSPSSLPSVADAVREAVSMLQPLLPLGELLTLHGMGQGRRAPSRAASVPDAAYEEREQLRRLKETHAALLKQASKPRPLDSRAAAPAATMTTESTGAAATFDCDDTAAAAAALLAVVTSASNTATVPTRPASDARLQRLQPQQAQLDKFAAFHGAVHTYDSPDLVARATTELELRPSHHGMGVFATRDLDAATFRCPYPGWLMSCALHSELHARFHIPTAIQLRTYSQQQRILVGDPSALGCVIHGVKQASDAIKINMAFAWDEMPRRAHSATTQAQTPSLCLRPTRDIAAGEELLLDSGGAFWPHVDQAGTLEHHCQVCFARECSAFNEMFVCEGTLPGGHPCSVGQHEHCFPNVTALPNRSARSHWFCEAHSRKQRRR